MSDTRNHNLLIEQVREAILEVGDLPMEELRRRHPVDDENPAARSRFARGMTRGQLIAAIIFERFRDESED